LVTLQTPTSLLLGIRNQDLAVVAVVVVVLIVLLGLALQRRRGPKLDVRKLDPVEGRRYVDEFAAIERDFVDHPDRAGARAKGILEEVMRRMGFPDRFDGRQRIRDLARYDRDAAASLAAAEKDLLGGAGDAERLRRVLQSYRDVLHRLLELPRAADP
jgi:hypothetical protein